MFKKHQNHSFINVVNRHIKPVLLVAVPDPSWIAAICRILLKQHTNSISRVNFTWKPTPSPTISQRLERAGPLRCSFEKLEDEQTKHISKIKGRLERTGRFALQTTFQTPTFRPTNVRRWAPNHPPASKTLHKRLESSVGAKARAWPRRQRREAFSAEGSDSVGRALVKVLDFLEYWNYNIFCRYKLDIL